MNTIRIWNGSASPNQLRDISIRLKEGELAIIPTDTMYAIVGDALNMRSVERLCRLKGINPEKTNLSVICSDISMASEYSRIENYIFRMMKQNCPGPFTFLLKAASTLPKAFKGRKVVGILIPDYEFDRQLAEYLGNPLITTTIEYEDEDYAVNQDLIAEAYYNKVEIMVDGGEGSTGLSTVVDCTAAEPEVIRQGIGEL